jgi:hypothetical protein
MHEHGPDELTGPVRGTSAWWRGLEAQVDPIDDGTPDPSTLLPKETKTKKPPRSARPIRTELVERVRKEIAAGTYDTQDKWEAALDRLLDRIERDGG